jgi:hypothetical protein
MAIRALGLTPEQFATETGLTTFETAHLLAAEPLPLQDYRAIFDYFLSEPRRAHHASALARACLADTLLECGLEEDLIVRLSAPTERDASVVHLFKHLSLVQLLALSIVGRTATKSDSVSDALFALAELCRDIGHDRTVPPGFFRQHMARPDGPKHLAGSIGATAAILARDEEQ